MYYANKSLDYFHQGINDGYRSNCGSKGRSRNSRFPKQCKQQSGLNSENSDKWDRKQICWISQEK